MPREPRGGSKEQIAAANAAITYDINAAITYDVDEITATLLQKNSFNEMIEYLDWIIFSYCIHTDNDAQAQPVAEDYWQLACEIRTKLMQTLDQHYTCNLPSQKKNQFIDAFAALQEIAANINWRSSKRFYTIHALLDAAVRNTNIQDFLALLLETHKSIFLDVLTSEAPPRSNIAGAGYTAEGYAELLNLSHLLFKRNSDPATTTIARLSMENETLKQVVERQHARTHALEQQSRDQCAQICALTEKLRCQQALIEELKRPICPPSVRVGFGVHLFAQQIVPSSGAQPVNPANNNRNFR